MLNEQPCYGASPKIGFFIVEIFLSALRIYEIKPL